MTNTITIKQHSDWTPQECDPEATPVKPEGLEDSVWETLSDYQQHAITQHIHPDDRISLCEIQAYLAASERMGVSEAQAAATLISQFAQVVETDLVIAAISRAGLEVAEIAMEQHNGPEALLKAIFGDDAATIFAFGDMNAD